LHKGPALPAGESQTTESTALTETGKSAGAPENPNLAEILFSESEIDADLRTVIERWEGLSVELRKAIVRMVQWRVIWKPYIHSYVLSVFLQFLCAFGSVDYREGAVNHTQRQTTINMFSEQHSDACELFSSFYSKRESFESVCNMRD